MESERIGLVSSGGNSFDELLKGSPRSLLITNIPFQSRGIGLSRKIISIVDTLLSQCGDTCTPPEPLMFHNCCGDDDREGTSDFTDIPEEAETSQSQAPLRVKVIVQRNVHGHVTNGTCLVIFQSPSEASVVREAWRAASSSSATSSPQVGDEFTYEGQQLYCDFGAGRVRDHSFPLYPFATRRQFALDGEGVFSVTDQISAYRISSLLKLLASLRNKRTDAASSNNNGGSSERNNEEERDAVTTLVDCMACVGGNTMEFCKMFANVVAIELDEKRVAALRHNLALVAAAETKTNGGEQSKESSFVSPTCIVGSCIDFIFAHSSTSGAPTAVKASDSVLFFDPPWGGPQYKEEMAKRLSAGGSSSLPSLAGMAADTTGENVVVITMEDVVLRACGMLSSRSEAPHAAIVAVKLPAVYDTTALAVAVTQHRPFSQFQSSGEDRDSRERNFPFRFHFGVGVVLFVVLVAGGEEGLNMWYANAALDGIVAAVVQWHETIGEREHRPEFYDYDKKRWIVLKKWIPSRRARSS